MRIINLFLGLGESSIMLLETGDFDISVENFTIASANFNRVGESSLPEQPDVSVPSPAGMS
jgi:hypothetical protein